MASGLFIVIEGLDGAGITTQVGVLRAWCEKRLLAVTATKEPSDGPAGALIRQALRHRIVDLNAEAMALLFAADRQDHLANEVLPTLSLGVSVICDRFVLSNLAYQLVDIGDLQWLRDINRNCPQPDLTIYLDVPAETSLKRIRSDNSRVGELQLYEEAGRLAKVRNNFLAVIPVLQAEGHRIAVLDGTRPAPEVSAEIEGVVRQLLVRSI